ncbi:hypothetical protein RRG08_020471 [Elysia crispata]|uniref:Uncharacterized protein n=1 Tax=Elysia crispata TaxID=231223 RepID=A0AAE1DW04_9GAST|nr:hypothetical protein RRG08_020471 [Elysia crispata]
MVAPLVPFLLHQTYQSDNNLGSPSVPGSDRQQDEVKVGIGGDVEHATRLDLVRAQNTRDLGVLTGNTTNSKSNSSHMNLIINHGEIISSFIEKVGKSQKNHETQQGNWERLEATNKDWEKFLCDRVRKSVGEREKREEKRKGTDNNLSGASSDHGIRRAGSYRMLKTQDRSRYPLSRLLQNAEDTGQITVFAHRFSHSAEDRTDLSIRTQTSTQC